MIRRYHNLIVTVGLLSITMTGCNNFLGLGPDKKNLTPPPDPPSLISPKDSSLFYTYSLIDFIWNSAEGAENYELQMESQAGSTMIFQAPSTTSMDHNFAKGHYHWSVRAYSPNWEDYTDWSEKRFLDVQIPINQNSKFKPSR